MPTGFFHVANIRNIILNYCNKNAKKSKLPLGVLCYLLMLISKNVVTLDTDSIDDVVDDD